MSSNTPSICRVAFNNQTESHNLWIKGFNMSICGWDVKKQELKVFKSLWWDKSTIFPLKRDELEIWSCTNWKALSTSCYSWFFNTYFMRGLQRNLTLLRKSQRGLSEDRSCGFFRKSRTSRSFVGRKNVQSLPWQQCPESGIPLLSWQSCTIGDQWAPDSFPSAEMISTTVPNGAGWR